MIDLEPLTLFSQNADRKPKIPWADLEPGGKYISESDVGVGLVTGEKSGVFVLDWDDTSIPPPGPMPETYVRRTRRGFHFYFQMPQGIRVPTLTKFPCPGWDIRGTGGFVVFAADGYDTEVDQEVAECPGWLLEKIAEYELSKMQREHTEHWHVDLTTPYGQQMLRQATNDAKNLPTGGPGERDQKLFDAANTLVRSRGMPVNTAIQLLTEHYAPRVSEDGRETVSPTRIAYKCSEAARVGTWEFIPFTDETIVKMRESSKPVKEAARRERLGLVDPKDLPARPKDVDYKPLRSADMVPSTGKPTKVSVADVTSILSTHHSWVGRLTYDKFAQEYRTHQPPVVMSDQGFFTTPDVTRTQCWFSSALNMQVGQPVVAAALETVAEENSYHPVQEYLSSLPPVDDPRQVLEDFASIGLGVTNPIVANYVKKFMIGAVRRVLNPGVKMDGVLVLKGEQNTGKSSLLYALSPERRWVQESLPDLRNKDAQEALRGRWLVEIAELQAVLRQEEATVKDFLSRQEDSYRRPYDRGTSRNPRQCVFIATTNDDVILRDPTGARRYWIVETPGVDLAWVKENRDAIWRAATDLASTEEDHQLTTEEIRQMKEIQEPFQDTDPWQDHIAAHLEGKEYVKSVSDVYLSTLQGEGVNMSAGQKNEALLKLDRGTARRIADTMKRLGWQKLKRGGYQCGWYAPGVKTMRKADA